MSFSFYNSYHLSLAPGAPKNVKYSDVSTNSVVISWEAPEFNGQFVQYHVTGGPKVETPTSSPITITGLQPDTYYLISVSAESSGGIGPATTVGPIFPAKSTFVVILSFCFNL